MPFKKHWPEGREARNINNVRNAAIDIKSSSA